MRENTPSWTALQVASTLAFLDADEHIAPLLPPGAADVTKRLLLASGALTQKKSNIYSGPLGALKIKVLETLAPGHLVHIALRKRFVDEESRVGLADNAEQLLVVGSGYDTLTLRLAADFPNVRFVEVDHPATEKVKRRGLEALGSPPNLELLPVDLSKVSLEQVLADCKSWRPDAKSLIVAEGLLMYLRKNDIVSLLGAVRRMTGPGSRLLFTYVSTDDQGRALMGGAPRFIRALLSITGEPALWGVRDLEHLESFFGQHQWRIGPAERHDLERRFLDDTKVYDWTPGTIEMVSSAEHGSI